MAGPLSAAARHQRKGERVSSPRKSEIATGVILLCLSGATLLGIRGLPLTHKGTGFGPGAFPLLVGIGLGILAVVQVVKSFFAVGRGTKSEGGPAKSQAKPATILMAIIGYTGSVNVLGFLVSTILFLFVATWIFGERRYLVRTLYAGSIACLTYLFFSVWLKVTLPVGSLW